MNDRRRWIALAAALLASALLAAPAAAQGPAQPPGSNDDCRPGQDPTPVVLVHGTFLNRQQFQHAGARA